MSDKMEYGQVERECKKMIRNKKNAYERNVVKNRDSNPKMYFAYVNSGKKNRSRAGPLKSDDGDFIVKPKEQAEEFSKYFASVFTRSDDELPTKEPINGNAWLGDMVVTEERVKQMIDGMQENLAPGPDGFPPILFKILRDDIAKPVSILFWKSIYDGKIKLPRDTKNYK